MEGFGELFGSIGEIFGGLVEFGGERGGEMAAEAVAGAVAGGRGEGDETATVDRVLAGGKRALNINDL